MNFVRLLTSHGLEDLWNSEKSSYHWYREKTLVFGDDHKTITAVGYILYCLSSFMREELHPLRLTNNYGCMVGSPKQKHYQIFCIHFHIIIPIKS